MALLTINEKKRVPTGEYGTIYKMKGLNAIPERRALTRPKLRSGPDFEREYKGRKILEDVINPYTGEVLYKVGTELTPEILQDISDHEIEYVDIDDAPDTDNDSSYMMTDNDYYEPMAKGNPRYIHNPTGIANPADYIGKVTIEKDTDNDGDLDTKITKE